MYIHSLAQIVYQSNQNLKYGELKEWKCKLDCIYHSAYTRVYEREQVVCCVLAGLSIPRLCQPCLSISSMYSITDVCSLVSMRCLPHSRITVYILYVQLQQNQRLYNVIHMMHACLTSSTNFESAK